MGVILGIYGLYRGYIGVIFGILRFRGKQTLSPKAQDQFPCNAVIVRSKPLSKP